jgi:hypothetical protein
VAEHYDVTNITVRPGTHPKALAALDNRLGKSGDLLACWYSEIGAVNQILIIRKAPDAAAAIAARRKELESSNPFGIGELITGLSMDTYVSLDFVAPMTPGDFGPCYEVRNYVLKPGGVAPTIKLWRKAVPGRAAVSPLLAAMIAATGPAIRFMHIWPYKSFDERARLRDKAVADGVWPPPGGRDLLVSQHVDIYLPAPFSPLR